MTEPHIHWVEEHAASGELAEIYGTWRAANPHRDAFPDILKCFSLRPDFLKNVMDFSYKVHFSDGFLTKQTKEMIATLVSAINQCPY